jgi:uncharacterized membrane protein
MDELLVALFDSDARAREGVRLLAECHAEGSLSVYAVAIVTRAHNGAGLTASEPVAQGKGAAAPAVAAAVGVLVSLLGGSVPAILRTVRSGLVSTVSEIYRAGLNAWFLERISRDLQPGGAAVIAEVEEERPPALDARIAALGGHTFRHHLEGTLAVIRIEHEVAALRGEVARLRERTQDGPDAATLEHLLRERAAELQQAKRRAGTLANALRREGVAKIVVLRAQMAGLDDSTRIAIEQRAATVRARFEARASSLDQVAEPG